MEIQIIKSLQSIGSNFLDLFFETISYISNYFGFILLFLILLIFINTKYSIYFAFTYMISICFNYFLKFITSRPRPYEVSSDIISKVSATGSSFPSGHTVSITIIACFILYLVWKTLKNKPLKITLTILISIFVLLVMLSRMYLGQHYLSDTIAGLFEGLIFSAIGLYIFRKTSYKNLPNTM